MSAQWLKVHTMRRWLEKVRCDGPQPALIGNKANAARHAEHIRDLEKRIQEQTP